MKFLFIVKKERKKTEENHKKHMKGENKTSESTATNYTDKLNTE